MFTGLKSLKRLDVELVESQAAWMSYFLKGLDELETFSYNLNVKFAKSMKIESSPPQPNNFTVLRSIKNLTLQINPLPFIPSCFLLTVMLKDMRLSNNTGPGSLH